MARTMDVRCNRCGTEYELDEARVASAGTTVKCSNCGHIFKVLPGGEVREGSGAHKVSTKQPSTETTRLPNLAATANASGTVPSAPSSAPSSASGEWMVRKVDGQIFRFRELTTLQKWIVERKVGRDDEISRTARSWKKLGEIAELTSFFQVVEAADAAQRPITASQLPQIHLTATPTGTFQAIPMPLALSHPPAPVFGGIIDEHSSAGRRVESRAMPPPPPPEPAPEGLDDNDPVFGWQRRRSTVLRTVVALAVGLVGVAAIVVALKHRPASTLSPAVREQVQLALQKGDEPARKVAMSALSASTVPAAPAVRARLQAEGARALRDAIRLGEEAVATAVANAAPGVVAGTPPPAPPPMPLPAAAATTAERLLAEADAAILTLRAAGATEVDADLAAATIALTRGDDAGITTAIANAREHGRVLDDVTRAAVDDELRLLLTLADAAHVDPRDVANANETIVKLERFNDVRAAAAAAFIDIGTLRLARERALTTTPPTVVDPVVVDAVSKRFAALPASDPRRTAGNALVIALSTLPAPVAVVAPVVEETPTALTPTAPTPTAPTAPTAPRVETSASVLKQAWAALDASRHSEAIRLFNKALSLSPSLSEAQFGLAEASRFAGKNEQAASAYRRYLEMDPSGKDANIAKNALKQLE